MFGFSNAERVLEAQLARISSKLSDYMEANDKLEEQLDIIKDKQRSATFIFDFDVYTVFSIERCWKKERDLTTISFTHDGKLVEWNFNCNEEIHENLCFQFQQWKSKNVGDLGNK